MIAELPDRVSGLGFLPGGTLLAVSMLDRRLIAVAADGATHVHADIAHLSRQFINDMVVDGAGRAYRAIRNGGDPASVSDSVILVDADGGSRPIIDRFVSPNGSVVTPDGKYLVIAETALGRLDRFRIDVDGALFDRTIIADLPGRHIDGLCMDAGGGFWAGGGTGGLLRIAPDGTLVAAIDFPGRMVLAAALGGPAGTTLYIATASLKLLDNLAYIGFDRAKDATVNSDGRIEAIEVEIPAA